MRITHLCEHNSFDPDSMSGTPFWISKGLEREDVFVHNLNISVPQKLLPPLEEIIFRSKQMWKRIYHRTHVSSDFWVRRAEHVATLLSPLISQLKTDVILTSHTPIAGAFLETKKPIILWTDAVFAALSNFYPDFRWLDPDTQWDAHIVTKACLMNATRLIFSSDWAARNAVEFYGISREKIKVVPFGANLNISNSLDDIKEIVKLRAKDCIKLLFIGKEWRRKGGDFALNVVEHLHSAGHKVELVIASDVPAGVKLPSYVKYLKILSKKNHADVETLKKYYRESHFLLLPTTADACPIVFAEANAFGLPCITSYVGGIPTAIKDDINGKTFSLEATVKDYCDYIVNRMNNDAEYEKFCLSAFSEYETRLNWRTSAREVKKIMAEII